MMTQQTNILLKAGTNEMEIIEFYVDELLQGQFLDRACYGINVIKVVEIIQKPKVTPLPKAPPGLLGTFISRGKVIPMVDLAIRLGKQKPESELNPLVIVTEFNRVTTALAVSGVSRIHRLCWGQIKPTGPFLDSLNTPITGIVNVEDRTILVLDMEKILSDLNPDLSISEVQGKVPSLTAGIQYKALIVDDSSSIRNILARQLESAGLIVRRASDGSEAWKWLQDISVQSQREGRPIFDYIDIVISDIEMPQMDGYSLCHLIKQDSILRALPVILFSSLINDKLFHKGQSVGADDQITKPEAGELAQRTGELIKRFRKQAMQ